MTLTVPIHPSVLPAFPFQQFYTHLCWLGSSPSLHSTYRILSFPPLLSPSTLPHTSIWPDVHLPNPPHFLPSPFFLSLYNSHAAYLSLLRYSHHYLPFYLRSMRQRKDRLTHSPPSAAWTPPPLPAY